jgi:hypothetical protein
LLAILALGTAAPFINGSRFGARVRTALESSLGRTVQFSAVHFTLFSGPGFSLENVVISEDPRYGLEPFAFVPTLQVRLRLDKLLLGQIRLSSLRLVDPSLNLVKRGDETWNVVELVNRLGASHHSTLNFFPALAVSDGRIDFKFGTRKTTVYIAGADLSIYPERSGRIYVQFSGSPARTDRAGNGFSHFRGSANWYLSASRANRLEADLNLDESNLSELTTLFEGHDIGIHGTVTSVAHIAGPLNALLVRGEMKLEDVHRWDLLPSRGEQWRFRYGGVLNLPVHRLDLGTISRAGETTPVSLQMRVSDFLTRPAWSIMANLHQAPLEQLLPIAKRMGINLPPDVSMAGHVNGAVGYSSNAGLNGGVEVRDAAANVSDLPPMRAASVIVTVLADHIHFDPVIVQTSSSGTLRAAGDYYFSGEKVFASLTADEFPVTSLRRMATAWFSSPDALSTLRGGTITGELDYLRNQIPSADMDKEKPSWVGQVRLAEAALAIPGVTPVLEHAQGRIAFDAETFDLTHFSAMLGPQIIHAAYHYNARAKRSEHIHLQIPSADLAQVEAALQPAFEDRSFFSRLRLTHRSVPQWLASRNLDGDLQVASFSVSGYSLGTLSSRFTWEGPILQLASIGIKEGDLSAEGSGSINLSSYSPRWRFQTSVNGFPWQGGRLSAEGDWQTAGAGPDMLRNLRAAGTFSGEDVNLTPSDFFDTVSGAFDFSFVDQMPNLRLSDIEASQDDNDWSGDAVTQNDGKLALNLVHGDRQMHIVMSLIPEKVASVTSLPTLTADAGAIR